MLSDNISVCGESPPEYYSAIRRIIHIFEVFAEPRLESLSSVARVSLVASTTRVITRVLLE